ncbi:BCCT family transporter [Oceanobacillus damuensis]|uniref:BCCT family transporter n=1 Tax=Oceanobacillus damuensis TaxID=937928 RepID=UPI0008337315|nr:BCCT family transporter [Oceanobacillus damuensis]
MKSITPVFLWSVALCLIILIWGVIAPVNLESVSNSVTAFFSDNFGWYYLLLVTVLLVFCIYLIFSRFGDIRLGKDGEKPEFNLMSWFAMLFSAGMGMGMVFWTTAEPISHAFTSPPNAEAGSAQAINESLQYSFFHWGVHAWAIYAVVALVLAYFKFHKDYPGLISATLVPLFGEKAMKGWIGTLIDVLAVFATVMGVAATLGFGSAQINSGLNYLFDIPRNYGTQLIVLIIATVLFIVSAWSGIHKGIKYLSNVNMGLGFLLLGMLFIVGPTIYILNMFVDTIGSYITNFFEMSFNLAPQDDDARGWINAWTIFYWAWWISWAPFVGIFIARISRGRTIKEFMIGVLFVPSIICFIFFAVFGVSALNIEQNGIAVLSDLPIETATFGVLLEYPLGALMSFITIFVIAIFFITSADSATFVLGMLSSKGSVSPKGSVKIIWGIILSAMAAIIVYFGGTQGLQNFLIISALPFSFVILLMAISFYKAARIEKMKEKLKPKESKKTALSKNI